MTLRAAAEQALDTLEHVQAHIGRYDPPVVTTIARAMQPTIDALRAALAAEQPQPKADERAENEALRREMADILTRTANALRGPPGPREAWGWADLPERAEAAIAAITTMTLAAQYAAAPPPAAPEPSEAQDAARYRWLRDHAKEALVRPETLDSEFPDTRTHWVLPALIAYGPVGGPTRTLDEAIDAALRAAAAARGR